MEIGFKFTDMLFQLLTLLVAVAALWISRSARIKAEGKETQKAFTDALKELGKTLESSFSQALREQRAELREVDAEQWKRLERHADLIRQQDQRISQAPSREEIAALQEGINKFGVLAGKLEASCDALSRDVDKLHTFTHTIAQEQSRS